MSRLAKLPIAARLGAAFGLLAARRCCCPVCRHSGASAPSDDDTRPAPQRDVRALDAGRRARRSTLQAIGRARVRAPVRLRRRPDPGPAAALEAVLAETDARPRRTASTSLADDREARTRPPALQRAKRRSTPYLDGHQGASSRSAGRRRTTRRRRSLNLAESSPRVPARPTRRRRLQPGTTEQRVAGDVDDRRRRVHGARTQLLIVALLLAAAVAAAHRDRPLAPITRGVGQMLRAAEGIADGDLDQQVTIDRRATSSAAPPARSAAMHRLPTQLAGCRRRVAQLGDLTVEVDAAAPSATRSDRASRR